MATQSSLATADKDACRGMALAHQGRGFNHLELAIREAPHCRFLAVIVRANFAYIDAEELLVTNRVSKSIDEYRHETVTVAALKRAQLNDAGLSPGQSISFVIVDNGKDGAERVRLDFEMLDDYDADWYEAEAVRAVESVLSPLGWHRDEIKQCLATIVDASLASY